MFASSASAASTIPRKVLAAAAHWHVERQCGSADPAALQAWRDASAEHERAWELLQHMDGQLGAIPAALAIPALQAAQQRRRAAARILAVLVAAGGGIALGQAGLQSAPWQALTASLRTAPGQRRHVALADGGRLEVNTDSALDVAYSATQRRIRLHHGEIMITTAPDARPFLVDTPHGVIRALGTRFGVRCDADGSVVSVFEHAVEVRCAARPDAVRRLEAGQQLRFSATGADSVQATQAHQDSWLRGMLVAADWPLQQLVQELARYRRGRLVCDAGVARRPVTGTYRLDDIDAVLESLCASHGLQVTYFTRYWATVAARST
ncbi:FecR domain-containing protein [Janthinobacterium sp. FW305-129]|uniref:FecR domain-containing protein n=1 Tax=Janthinobacterium sp. FW305-129 TaxID=2775054 RepID=UPI001E49CE4D|nr:FecR domain-containing protein [Janthinobacterium sp. FW305-129]MCC7597704.1 FecR domain-containing protein [Janthinobacterium sp. FW305-129]